MLKNTIIYLLFCLSLGYSITNDENMPSKLSFNEVFKWPFENVIQPVFSTLLYPLYPPLVYVDSNDIIDRMIDLSTWGSDGRYLSFPLVNVFGNADSYLGYRHYVKNIFGIPQSKLNHALRYCIDGDYSTSLGLSKVIGSYAWGFNIRKNTYSDVYTFIPALSQFSPYKVVIHSDSSLFTNYNLSLPFIGSSSISFDLGINYLRYNSPILMKNENSDLKNYLSRRGFYANYFEVPFNLSIGNNTKESDYTPTYGAQYGLQLTLAYEQGYGNYMAMGGQFQKYTLLGNQAYSINKKEDKERLRKFMRFKLEHALPFAESEDWKESLFNRKVFVTTLRFRQLFDIQDQPTVLQAYSTLGTGSPLRAYSGSRFLSYGMLSYGNEYRWPMIRKVDGVVFNEYGVYFDDPRHLSEWTLKNSWGYGMRFTNPDLYFLRLQIAFHGFNGFGILLTTSPEFN